MEKCEECGKSFAYEANLREHSQFHTGENPPEPRPYSCDVFGASFRDSNKLRRHQNFKIHQRKGFKPLRKAGKTQLKKAKKVEIISDSESESDESSSMISLLQTEI